MKRHFRDFFVLAVLILIFSFSIGFKDNDDQKEKLLQIAKEYKTYSAYAKYSLEWTVAGCRAPMTFSEIDSVHFFSKAEPELTKHGNKMYKFFISDIQSYKDTTLKNQPFGQVLVKETWNIKEAKTSTEKLSAKQSENDGKWYIPTTVSELFIMYKEEENENNDKGWVYGIVNLENEEVKILTNGKISSCISCHKGTKYDRIFGMEKEKFSFLKD